MSGRKYYVLASPMETGVPNKIIQVNADGTMGATGATGADGSYTVVTEETSYTLPSSADAINTQVIYNNSSAIYSLLGSLNISGTIYTTNISSTTTVSSFTPTIYTTAYDSTYNRLYIGGNFRSIGNILCSGIAYYDFSAKTWNAFTRTSGSSTYTGINPTPGAATGSATGTADCIFSIKVDSSGNVYVGGNFTSFVGYLATGLAIYTKSSNTWVTSDPSISGSLPSLGSNVSVYSLLVSSGNILYIGGNFSATVSPNTANNIVQYNISSNTFSTVGTKTSPSIQCGVNSTVYALETDGTNIYIGGSFTATKDSNSLLPGIAKYSGSGPLAEINGGLAGTCYSLLYKNSKLYVGGLFGYVGATNGSTANNLAVVSNLSATTQTWTPLSTQVSGLITSLVIHSSTNKLYIGTMNKGVQIYDLTNSVAIPTNIVQNTEIYSLYIDSSSNLYIGGKFIGLGNSPITSFGYCNLNNILNIKYNGTTLASVFENGTGAVFAYYNSTWNNITNFVSGL